MRLLAKRSNLDRARVNENMILIEKNRNISNEYKTPNAIQNNISQSL